MNLTPDQIEDKRNTLAQAIVQKRQDVIDGQKKLLEDHQQLSGLEAQFALLDDLFPQATPAAEVPKKEAATPKRRRAK